MEAVKTRFVRAAGDARPAARRGFEMLELHMAHG